MKLSRLRELMNSEDLNVCVHRGPGIGDVLMATPAIRSIAETFPACTLTVATDTKYLNGAIPKVLQGNPHIDRVLDVGITRIEEYDMYVDLHCPCVPYEKNKNNPPRNRIDLFGDHIGIPLDNYRPVYVPKEEEIEWAGEKIQHLHSDQPKVLIQPSASCDRRSYPHFKMKRVVTELAKRGYACFLATHTEDWYTDVLWNNIQGAHELMDWDVREIAAFMTHCDLVLCQDSAILHLAGALDVPAVALFGPTHPEARVNHYPRAIGIWGGKDLGPCPCWYDTCYIGAACWNYIYEDTVVETCIRHLEETRK